MLFNKTIVKVYSRKENFKNSNLDKALEDNIIYNDVFIYDEDHIIYIIILNLDTQEKMKYYEEKIKQLLIEDNKDGKLYHNIFINQNM